MQAPGKLGWGIEEGVIEDVPTAQRRGSSVKTYAVDVNTSRTLEEGVHSPSLLKHAYYNYHRHPHPHPHPHHRNKKNTNKPRV